MAFVRVARAADIQPGAIQEVQADGSMIALANIDGKFHAISNVCLHRGGPLGQGQLQGSVVTCPWHAWSFDVTTGKVVGSKEFGVASYPVEVRGEEVFVDLGGNA